MDHHYLETDDWQTIVEKLGGAESLASSARLHKAFLRPRRVRTAADLLRLALMYGPCRQSLRMVSSVAMVEQVADLSDVAVLQRLRNAAEWLEALCLERFAGSALGLGVQDAGLGAGRAIRIVDGSRLEGPGNRFWRMHLAYDPCAGRLTDARITPSTQGERLDRLAVQAGDIVIADRGFPQPDGIRNVLDAKADVLVRVTWNSLRLSDPQGRTLDWMALFEEASAQGSLDRPVCLTKARGRFEPITLRLVMIPKPPEAAARARVAARKASRKDQRAAIDPRTLAGADHLIVITSLPRDTVGVEQLGGLYRLRWQIEIAFKRLKSIMHFDQLPAKDERLARAWLHAHLLFALLVDGAQAEIMADEDAVEETAFSPEGTIRQPLSLWRVTVLLVRSLAAAICPPMGLSKAKAIIPTLAQLYERPRKRRLQMQHFALC